jgi:hypothetical protein
VETPHPVEMSGVMGGAEFMASLITSAELWRLGTIFAMMAILVIFGTLMEWIAHWMPRALGN